MQCKQYYLLHGLKYLYESVYDKYRGQHMYC